jgi:hypothetical protein
MSIKFSREPVVWAGALVAIALLVQNIVEGNPLTTTIVEPVVVALGALIVRSKVTPVANISEISIQAFRDGQNTANYNPHGDEAE